MEPSSCLLLFALLAPQGQAPASLDRDGPDVPELVLVEESAKVPLAAFGLGDGGIQQHGSSKLHLEPGEAHTPGGVRVQALRQGVKLTFPSGRELLFTPSGFLHLRDGAEKGPFTLGVELRLGDGSSVRIDRSGSRRSPVQEVVVVTDGRADRIWSRDYPVLEFARCSPWNGIRLLCCGEGDMLYRAIAAGPLVTLERCLCPKGHEAEQPERRLALLTAPMITSLQELQSRRVRADPQSFHTLRTVSGVVANAQQIFAAKGLAVRVDRNQPRYSLLGGFEVAIEAPAGDPMRITLHAGMEKQALAEWTLGYFAQLRLLGADPEGSGAARYLPNSVRLPDVVPELTARAGLRELAEVRTVLLHFVHP
jgi:hypothetical protein